MLDVYSANQDSAHINNGEGCLRNMVQPLSYLHSMLKDSLEHPLNVASLMAELSCRISWHLIKWGGELKQVKDGMPQKVQNGEAETEEDLLVINPGRLPSHSSVQSHCCSAFPNNEEKLG